MLDTASRIRVSRYRRKVNGQAPSPAHRTRALYIVYRTVEQGYHSAAHRRAPPRNYYEARRPFLPGAMTVSLGLLRLTRAQRTPYAMRMRISFSTGTFYHRPLAYSLQLARALGFDGVEYVVGPDYFLSGIEPLRKAIGRYAIPVLSIHPPFHMLTTLPLTNWPRQGGWAWPRTTALGRELGATLAVTHTVFLAGPHVPRMARYQAALRMGREAGGGLTLTIESNQYNRRGKRFLLDDLRRLVDFAQEQDCGVTLDTCHAGA